MWIATIADALLCPLSRFNNVCFIELGSLMLLQSWPEGARRTLSLPIVVICSGGLCQFCCSGYKMQINISIADFLYRVEFG